MEKNGIEWDEVKDNLRVFEVNENDFIDLGNPFGRERPYLPRPSKPVPVRPSIPRWSLVVVAVLFLVIGFFFGAIRHIGPEIRVPENGQIKCVEMEYDSDLELTGYSIVVGIVDRGQVDRYLRADLDSIKPFSLKKTKSGIEIKNISEKILEIHLPGKDPFNLNSGESFPFSKTAEKTAITVIDRSSGIQYKITIVWQVIARGK